MSLLSKTGGQALPVFLVKYLASRVIILAQFSSMIFIILNEPFGMIVFAVQPFLYNAGAKKM